MADKPKDEAAVTLGRRGGAKGGFARAASLTPERRTEIARKAAVTRWGKPPVNVSDIEKLSEMEKTVLSEAITLLSTDHGDLKFIHADDLGSALAKLNALLSLVERPAPADVQKPRVKAKWVCVRCGQAMRGPELHPAIEDCLRWLVQRFDAALKG